MIVPKRVVLEAARRKLFQSSPTIRISPGRFFSSVSPVYNDDEHDEEWTGKQKTRAMQLPKVSSSSTTTSEVVQGDSSNRNESSFPARSHPSPAELTYTGNVTMPITTELRLVTPDDDTPSGIWPVFRLMDEDGTFRDGSNDGYTFDKPSKSNDRSDTRTAAHKGANESLDKLRESLKKFYPLHANEMEHNGLLSPAQNNFPDTESNHTLHRAHRHMIRLREMDTILQNAQRQGRISFYMTCHGEEAIHIGAASALELQDNVLAQYREAGLLMWRGFTLEQFTDQCFSNKSDLGKGRQMPVHYGSRALNYQTISSPLGTQIPQAAGAAYRLKLQGKEAVAMCFFGDGCASTTDFHSGLNFAATLGSPVIFFCRNNGYAISTPITDQYNGDGIVSRGPGYGIASIRIDGNDIYAVHAAVREAREYAIKHKAPVLIEAMSYRQGHHSTSDDSLRYRSAKEVKTFVETSDPVDRLQNFLRKHDRMEDTDFTAIRDEEKMAVIEAMREAERKPKPPLKDLFHDVYHEMPQSLKDQERQLHEHLAKYPSRYK